MNLFGRWMFGSSWVFHRSQAAWHPNVSSHACEQISARTRLYMTLMGTVQPLCQSQSPRYLGCTGMRGRNVHDTATLGWG